MTKITKVTIYRDTATGKWCYAAWSDDGHDHDHDHNDIIPDAESETEAREWVRTQWPDAVVRVI